MPAPARTTGRLVGRARWESLLSLDRNSILPFIEKTPSIERILGGIEKIRSDSRLELILTNDIDMLLPHFVTILSGR